MLVNGTGEPLGALRLLQSGQLNLVCVGPAKLRRGTWVDMAKCSQVGAHSN